MAPPPSRSSPRRNFLSQTLSTLLTATQAAWNPYHSQSIAFMAVAGAPLAERDAQTSEWRAMKLAELNIVSVTGALIASVVTTTLSWSPPNPMPNPKPWTVTGLWLSSLLFALASVVLATQQSVVLARASTGQDSLSRIRVLMSAAPSPSTANGNVTEQRYAPNVTLLYIWQAGTMCLGVSIVLLVVGLLVLVFDQVSIAGAWGSDAKVAIWTFISGIFCLGTYLISWWGTEVKFQKLCLEWEGNQVAIGGEQGEPGV